MRVRFPDGKLEAQGEGEESGGRLRVSPGERERVCVCVRACVQYKTIRGGAPREPGTEKVCVCVCVSWAVILSGLRARECKS